METGFEPLTGEITFETSLPNIRIDESARQEWLTAEQDAALTKLWEQMKEKHPERYRDTDAQGNPLKLYYHELEFDEQGNIQVKIGEMGPKDFYPLDWLETNGEKKSEYNLTPEEWRLLESIKQKGLLNPSAILTTNDGRDNYVQMSENTAVPDEIQCAGAALQPIPDTDPPQFDLVQNVKTGLMKKTGLEETEIGDIKPVGVAFWQKSDNGPAHTTVIYEAKIPNKSAEQLQQHVEEYSRTLKRPQVKTAVSVDPRSKEESRALSDRLPDSGQRAYVKEVVEARAREHTRGTLPQPRTAAEKINFIIQPLSTKVGPDRQEGPDR